MFNIFMYLPYKILIFLVFGVALSMSSASEPPSADEDEKNGCGITVTNISKKAKQISGLKTQCQKDYERVQSYCTEKGLATIQMISVGGQTVANAVNILKSDGKPESAKKAMGMSKNLSYGLGALNAGIGAKCLSNISSCSGSCGSAEKTKECLQTFKDTTEASTTLAPNPLATTAISKAGALIGKLEKVDGYALSCKQLKSNAYAALAQGALHGATGLIQAEMEKNLGREVEEENADTESEAFNPPEPNPPESPTLSGEPGVNLNDGDTTDNTDEVGQFAGNQINKNPSNSGEDSADDIGEGYRDIDSISGTEGTFSGDPYGSSGSSSTGSIGDIPFSSGDAGQGTGSAGNLNENEEETGNGRYRGAGSFAGSAFSGGGSGGGDYYGGDDGYYEEEPLAGEGLDSLEDIEENKKEDELEQLKKSIGGKHESIFEKASKVLANYCMEGPLKCE